MKHELLEQLSYEARVLLENVYGRHNDLAGKCGIASLYLMRLARRNGIKVVFCHGFFENRWSHCWVQYGNIVYDITATQFGKFERVYVASPESNRLIYYITKISEAKEFIESWCNPVDIKKLFG